MSEVVKRCAACGKENPVSSMKTCMHSQMHYYVCDSKCMTDFYNPPKKPTERELRIKAETERDAALAELAALKGGREALRYVCHACHADTPPPKPYRAFVSCDKCGEETAATRAACTAPPAQASAEAPAEPKPGHLQVDALRKAQGILTRWLIPDGIAAEQALTELIAVLDNEALAVEQDGMAALA